MKHLFCLLGATMLLAGVSAAPALAGDHPDNVTLCHAAGLDGTTHYETLTVGYEAAYGPAGHFDENGTPNAGHEQDYLGECNPPPPLDVCPNLEGNQGSLPPGYHFAEDENGRTICVQDEVELTPLATGASFTEATCTTAPSVQLTKTNIPGLGLRPFYNVEGPDFVDGHPVAGGTYTFTPISIVGYVLTGGTVFTHTFAAAPTGCGTPPPGNPAGNATVICLMPQGVYQLFGTVDGQAADSVNPATLPGNTKGVSNVTVTRGDTSVRTTVATNGDCSPSTAIVTVTPPVVTTPATPATPASPAKPAKPAKPAAKPKPKPKPKPAKPAAKPKPKPKAHKPGPHVCTTLKDGTRRHWWKGGNGMPAGCYPIIKGSG